MALEDVLATVAAHPGVGGHGGRAARALQGLRRRLKVVVEVYVLNHQVTRNDRQRKVNLHNGSVCIVARHLSGCACPAMVLWRLATQQILADLSASASSEWHKNVT